MHRRSSKQRHLSCYHETEKANNHQRRDRQTNPCPCTRASVSINRLVTRYETITTYRSLIYLSLRVVPHAMSWIQVILRADKLFAGKILYVCRRLGLRRWRSLSLVTVRWCRWTLLGDSVCPSPCGSPELSAVSSDDGGQSVVSLPIGGHVNILSNYTLVFHSCPGYHFGWIQEKHGHTQYPRWCHIPFCDATSAVFSHRCAHKPSGDCGVSNSRQVFLAQGATLPTWPVPRGIRRFIRRVGCLLR